MTYYTALKINNLQLDGNCLLGKGQIKNTATFCNVADARMGDKRRNIKCPASNKSRPRLLSQSRHRVRETAAVFAFIERR